MPGKILARKCRWLLAVAGLTLSLGTPVLSQQDTNLLVFVGLIRTADGALATNVQFRVRKIGGGAEAIAGIGWWDPPGRYWCYVKDVVSPSPIARVGDTFEIVDAKRLSIRSRRVRLHPARRRLSAADVAGGVVRWDLVMTR